MKIVLHIVVYLLTFVGYAKALAWALEHGHAKVPTSDAMGQGMKDALSTLIYAVLAIAVIYATSILIAKYLLKGSAFLSVCINTGLLLLWVAIFLFVGLNKKEKTLSDYLIMEINTPDFYPVTVYDWAVTLPDGDVYRFGREEFNTIAVEGITWGKGGEEIPIPSDSFPIHIDIRYLSYVEDKMYHVEGDLPIEKINQLYHGKHADGLKEEKDYDGLVIGCAPYGVVQIWLRSDLYGGRRTEVCLFKGKEDEKTLWGYKADCHGIYYKIEKERVRSDVWENLEANGLPDTLFFENSHIRYNYRIVIEAEDNKLEDMELVFCNGEYDIASRKQAPDRDYKMLACPKDIRLEWADGYKTRLEFKPGEIFDFFSSSFGNDCSQPGDFVIRLDEKGGLQGIRLKVGKNISHYCLVLDASKPTSIR